MDNNSQIPPLVPQPTPQPMNVVAPAALTPEPENPKSKKKIMVAAIIIVLVILTTALAGGVYAIAYEKITLPDQELQRRISHFTMSLPFTPKTPRYVLERSLMTHTGVTKHSFNISLAIDSSGLASILGLSGKLDILAKGAIDYSDPKNIIYYADIDLPQTASFKLRKPDNNLYIKIENVNQATLAILGIDKTTFEQANANWISYEVITLDTPARQRVEEQSQPFTDRLREKIADAIDEPDLINKTLGEDIINGVEVYKITATIDEDFFTDMAGYYPSVDQMKLEIYIDKKDFLVRRLATNTTISQSAVLSAQAQSLPGMIVPPTGNEVAFLAVVADFSDYSSEVTVEKPPTSISVEEFIAQLLPSEETSPNIINPARQFHQARDTQRRADLLSITNAIYQYAAENNGKLPGSTAFPKTPTCIGTASECFNLGAAGGQWPIVPTYIAAIPTDPNTGSDLNTGYTIYINTDGRLVATATGEIEEEITVLR